MELPHLDETRPSKIRPDADHLEDTAPTSLGPAVLPETQPMAASPVLAETTATAEVDQTPVGDGLSHGVAGKPRRWTWALWAFAGLFLLTLIAAGSGFAGYRSAIEDRSAYAATLVAGDAKVQYDLAIQDIQLGNYELARQRLEYVIQLDPAYPGAAEALAVVLQELRTTATPTLVPTPTLTPTPDLRGRDELYNQAQALLAGREWSAAIETLLTLRKQYPDYQAVRVDGMLYVALRNRGVDKIIAADLEGGTYDLSLAERFGPLDAEARNYRDWAETYIRGASFWGVDWAQSVYYFSQLAVAVPNLSDASGWTAANRYRDALLGYADWLAGRGEWCLAAEQYATYLGLYANPQVEPTAVYADEQCNQGGQLIPTETITPAPGGTPGSPPPEATPTPYP